MKMMIVLIGMLGAATSALAQTSVTLTTESYAPFTYRNADGTYHGSSVEQVEALMRKAGIPFTMEIMPWARAIVLAETQPMNCVFSAARIPERENRFKWVTPLSINRHVLVRLAGSSVKPGTIEEARRYTIGTHRADFTETLLREQDFMSIDLSADFEITLNKLLERRIDMVPMSESMYERLKSEGKPLEIALPFSESHFGMACNKQMPDDMIAGMQEGLDALIREKGQDEILQRYGLKPLRLWEK
jgi:polar amino acid transport system substrate-binding protein